MQAHQAAHRAAARVGRWEDLSAACLAGRPRGILGPSAPATAGGPEAPEPPEPPPGGPLPPRPQVQPRHVFKDCAEFTIFSLNWFQKLNEEAPWLPLHSGGVTRVVRVSEHLDSLQINKHLRYASRLEPIAVEASSFSWERSGRCDSQGITLYCAGTFSQTRGSGTATTTTGTTGRADTTPATTTTTAPGGTSAVISGGTATCVPSPSLEVLSCSLPCYQVGLYALGLRESSPHVCEFPLDFVMPDARWMEYKDCAPTCSRRPSD